MKTSQKNDTSLNHLYGFLKQYKLSDSLYLIACINAAFKYGRYELSNVDIPPYIKLWLGRIPKTPRNYLQINLDASRIARFLLLSGTNDYKNKTLKIEDNSLFLAMTYVGELYDKEVEQKELEKGSASKIMGRLSQWQFPLQADRQPIIGRAYLLYITIPEELKPSYQIEQKMREYYKIGAFEFMATGMALWLKTNGILDYEMKIEIDYLKNVVTLNSMMKFLELSSGTAADYKRFVRGDNWKNVNKLYDIYYLDPLIRIPAIKVENSIKLRNGTYLVPNAKYLLDRASNGVFYLLSDAEQKIGQSKGHSGQNPFRKMFGDIYRNYVGKQLMQGQPETKFLDLDNDLLPINGLKIPDFALVKDDICVLFEVKLNIMKLESRTFFDDKELECEVRSGNIKKAIRQLNDFRIALLNHTVSHPKLDKVGRVIIVLVSYEDIFIANASLLPLLKAEYGTRARDMQLACVSDIEAMGNTLDKKEDLISHLCKKIDNIDTEHFALVTYFENLSGADNRILTNAFEAYMHHLSHGIQSN